MVVSLAFTMSFAGWPSSAVCARHVRHVLAGAPLAPSLDLLATPCGRTPLFAVLGLGRLGRPANVQDAAKPDPTSQGFPRATVVSITIIEHKKYSDSCTPSAFEFSCRSSAPTLFLACSFCSLSQAKPS